MVAVTVILAIAHIVIRCCNQATELVGKSSLLACMLTVKLCFHGYWLAKVSFM